MKTLEIKIFCALASFYVLLSPGESLKCRSSIQPGFEIFPKTMQYCTRKHALRGIQNSSVSTSSGEKSSEEDSASSVSTEQEFYFGDINSKSSDNNSRNTQAVNANQTSDRGSRTLRNRKEDSTYPQITNPTNYNFTEDRNENRNNHNGASLNHQSDNGSSNQTNCVLQCFFEELNTVNKHGFPERGLVVDILTRGIEDPVLRDFIEESIFECFRYLANDTRNRDRCIFATNLVNCYNEKEQEKCEDIN